MLWRKESVEREPTIRQDLSSEAEESPLLEVVTRGRLVKTQQAEKDLAGAVVICREMSSVAVIACSSESCGWVVNKFNIQSKPRL
jgi:hypothetical protein